MPQKYVRFHFEQDQGFCESETRVFALPRWIGKPSEILDSYRESQKYHISETRILDLGQMEEVLLHLDTRYCIRRNIGIDVLAAIGGNLDIYDPIETLDLSTRAYNALRKKDILTIGELITCTETDLIELVSNLGKRSFENIEYKLSMHGLTLRLEFEPPTLSHLWLRSSSGCYVPADSPRAMPEHQSDPSKSLVERLLTTADGLITIADELVTIAAELTKEIEAATEPKIAPAGPESSAAKPPVNS